MTPYFEILVGWLVATLAKTITESSLVWECMQVIGKLIELNKVTLVWISGHQWIPGNEEADRLAKEGAIEVPPNKYVTMPFIVGQKLKKQFELEHQDRWTACTGC
jgi:ribonuclease HI